MKRFLAFLLTLIMILSLLPTAFAAAPEKKNADVWEQITVLEDQTTATRGTVSLESRAAAYSSIVDQIIDIVEDSENYVPGSIIRHGDFFYWDEVDGTACGYSPRLRAQIREGANPNADPEAYSAIDVVSYDDKGGSPSSINVAAFQPYIGIDGSFTNQYEVRCNSIAQALGGTGTTYKTTNATIDNIASAIASSAVVIFDSHGDTDYAGSGGDYTSRANTSYLCLQSGAGITAEDQQTVTGPYGDYKHAYYAGGYGSMQYYCVDGTAISNHMTGTSPNGLLWMAICLGMATDGMHAPLRAKGVEVAYGYSQSVTFSGDYAWEGKFWPKMIQGAYVKDAIAYMKQTVGCPDPYTGSYPAYPIVVSSEDVYPGHGNVDATQNVYSTWTLFTQYEINAVSNNTEWGTVQVSGTKITATPVYGYYVDGYDILSGQATVTREGNVFNVTPETDCTIQINFAPRDPAVVQFSVPNGVSCDPINVYVGDDITLPTPEGEPAIETRTFRFLGWSTTPIQEDTLVIPEYLEAGTEVKVESAETTYYALYTYFVAVEGLRDDQFVRVDEAPANTWNGEYVITCDGAYALGASSSYMNSSSNNNLGTSKSVVDVNDAGLSYEDNILSGVTDEITYVISAAEDGNYTVKMKNENRYLALAADKDSLHAYTSSNSDKSRWTISYGANGSVLTNAQYANRSLQYDDAAIVFNGFAVAKKGLTLFKKAEGDNWYTTAPKEKVECEEHSFGEWEIELEPTCTESGTKHRYCTVCGFKEVDTVDALGHEFGEWTLTTEPTCTEAGEETRGCIRCDAVETRPVEALGHDYVAGEPVVPSCTEQGYTTYTCSRCGDSYDGDLVEALGHTWDDGVVTTAPTLTEEGVRTYTCTVCGATKTEAVPMLVNPFEDVSESDYFFNPVLWAISQDPQVTSGVDATHFAPDNECTREQIVTFLWAANGKPEPETTESPFSDVSADAWYFKAVMWAVENKITSGMDEGVFGVGVSCTRAQAMTFLWAANGKPEPETTESPFDDVKTGDWFCKAILWAAENEITAGVGNGLFGVNNTCTRAQIVTFLYKAMQIEQR